jgi:hypothetical protein
MFVTQTQIAVKPRGLCNHDGMAVVEGCPWNAVRKADRVLRSWLKSWTLGTKEMIQDRILGVGNCKGDNLKLPLLGASANRKKKKAEKILLRAGVTLPGV